MTFAEDILAFMTELRAIPLRGPSEFFFDRARKRAVRRYGFKPNPLGLRNKKIQGPALYRPTGPTCPPYCPYFVVCYAGRGNVNLHSKRASDLALPALVSVAIAIVATELTNVPIRLQVSGDFWRGDSVDLEYVNGLVILGGLSEHPEYPWGWTYTHVIPEEFELSRLRLHAAGLEVLYSDRFEVGGAVVWPFDELDELRADPGVTYVKCLEQLNGTPCIVCKLCLTSRDEGICIVFKPHSGNENKITKIAKEVRADWLRRKKIAELLTYDPILSVVM